MPGVGGSAFSPLIGSALGVQAGLLPLLQGGEKSSKLLDIVSSKW